MNACHRTMTSHVEFNRGVIQYPVNEHAHIKEITLAFSHILLPLNLPGKTKINIRNFIV